MSIYLVTNSDIRTYLKMSTNLVTQTETFLSDLIEEITGKIYNEVNQDILTKTTVYQTKGNGLNCLTLPNFPVQSLSGIRYKEIGIGDTWKSFLTTDYEFEKDGIIYTVYLINNLFKENYTYEFTYTYGYATCPADLKLSTIKLVAEAYKQSNYGEGYLGKQSISGSLNGVSDSTSFADVWKQELNTIENYKIIAF